MKKFAVAWIYFGGNELEVKLIEAETWREAVTAHPRSAFTTTGSEQSDEDYRIPDELEDAKQAAFDCDTMFDVLELS